MMMTPTDTTRPDHFHKVVDCQWACPAHTPVPQYIGLIAEGRHAEAYMVNWEANVFPGILGRTCDRPCEPACRRGRVEKEPVAICRLKRVAADHKGDIRALLPRASAKRNGKKIALVGAGPASLTVARDLAPLGFHCVILDQDPKAGGMMRSRIPSFRLPESVIDEEVGYVLDLGVEFRAGQRIASMKDLLGEGWDAVFVGTGAPRALDLPITGRREAAANIHLGLDWLAGVRFGHIDRTAKHVVVLGGGNTAVDCARTARRLGADTVTVVARSSLADLKASSWERDALRNEGIEIAYDMVPQAFTNDRGRLTGVTFERVRSVYEAGQRQLISIGGAPVHISCDEVLIAVGQQPAFPWIERDLGIEFNDRGLPKVDPQTLRSTHPTVFFGGDAAFGPQNIISAVAHGHEAAISIELLTLGRALGERPSERVSWEPQRMPLPPRQRPTVALHGRTPMPLRNSAVALSDVRVEHEVGFDLEQAVKEAARCLHCEVETVFKANLCVECKACETVCPTNCITYTKNGDESELRKRLKAPAANTAQDLFVQDGLVSGRVMVKDEDICLHCGLCAENCPTGAWQMSRFLLLTAKAGVSDE